MLIIKHWLNIYNAFVQKLLTDNPGKFKKRNSFFSDQQITLAGRQLSLDDIEHGILRRSKTFKNDDLDLYLNNYSTK